MSTSEAATITHSAGLGSLAGDFRNAIQLKETVASAMTASQMDEAERLVANWRPKPHKCEFEPLQSYY
jgi:hypothetical protein